MLSRGLLGLLGLFHLLNGLTMLFAPEAWYAAVPGVSMTGPINHHFITDIGLAFIASGAGMMVGIQLGKMAATLALAGATWPALHALFHVWGWLADGFPHDSRVAIFEVVGVVLVSFLGLALAAMRAWQEGVV